MSQSLTLKTSEKQHSFSHSLRAELKPSPKNPRITSKTSLSGIRMEEVLQEDPSVRGTPTPPTYELKEPPPNIPQSYISPGLKPSLDMGGGPSTDIDQNLLGRYFSSNEVKSKDQLQSYRDQQGQVRPTTSHLNTVRNLSRSKQSAKSTFHKGELRTEEHNVGFMSERNTHKSAMTSLKPAQQEQQHRIQSRVQRTTSQSSGTESFCGARFENVFREVEANETLGAMGYYLSEEKKLDQKISKAVDNPANQRGHRYGRKKVQQVGSFDWGVKNFAEKYQKYRQKVLLQRDTDFLADVIDYSHKYAFFKGEATTRQAHSLMKRKIEKIKHVTLQKMCAMNIKPPTYWRAVGPTQERQINKIFSPEPDPIMVLHDADRTNTSALSTLQPRELSPLSSPPNRHSLINHRYPRIQTASATRRDTYESLSSTNRTLSTRRGFRPFKTFTSGFQSDGVNLAIASPLSEVRQKVNLLGAVKSSRQDDSARFPLETPKFNV